MISDNFSRSEFACKCGCGFASVDVELIEVLEFVRATFAAPVTINSACRCESHNASVGGSEASYHKKGMAADIVVGGVSPASVQNFLQAHYPGKFGIGRYSDFTHIDVRPNSGRW